MMKIQLTGIIRIQRWMRRVQSRPKLVMVMLGLKQLLPDDALVMICSIIMA